MFEVKSDMIHKIGFDSTTPGLGRGYLVVQFANFKAYGYQNVEWCDYLLLANAPSIGAVFSAHIKETYKGELLTPNDDHAVIPTELSSTKETFEVDRSPKTFDQLVNERLTEASGVPMLDVMGVDTATSKVGKVSSITHRKKK